MAKLVGKTLGKYRVVARLGRGGMAEVYKAYQPNLDRYVAIKVMHGHLSADEEFLSRFQREALATGKLSHPNIVQALDFDNDSGVYFMVMQFINGPTLKDEMKTRHAKNQAFSLEEIARIYQALGEAIDYAHNRGMVHRDIKPANIMIDEDGQVLLTDFGIARMVEGTQYTATGAMTGTPSYMSPEQGQGLKVDGRSDIYALGIILYELITRRIPYEAETPIATIMKHINAALPLPSKLAPHISSEVENVILKAMAKKPDDRFQSGRKMARALAGAVALPPGDSLQRTPLNVTASPPRSNNEMDPNSGTFTSINAATSATANSGATIATGQMAPHPDPATSASGSKWPLIAGLAAIVLVLLIAGAMVSGIFAGRSNSQAEANAAATTTAAEAAEALALAQITEADATATALWATEDNDGDGLLNAEEVELGTSPERADTDNDGLNDDDELNQFNTDPLNPDSDGDTIEDMIEIAQRLNPLSADTDGDGQDDATDPDPNNAPLPTPTETPQLIVAATDTPAAQPEPTEEPTVTPSPTSPPATPTPAPAVVSAAAPGVFQGFETASSWRRGDQPYGELTRTTSQVHSGSYAGELSYNFPTNSNDFVVFLQSRSLSGQPTALSAWVYGDGSGHFLNAWIKDNGGQTWTMSFGQITHTGWQQMVAPLNANQPWPSGAISGPDNGQIDYPISFQGLTLDDGNDSFSGQGVIYIDDLSSEVAPVVASNPTATPAAPGGGNSGNSGNNGGGNVTTSPSGGPPIVDNGSYRLEVSSDVNYAQPWGAPVGGDTCQTFEDGNWDDTQPFYRGLTIEMQLTNNTDTKVPDDWGGVEYVTGAGERGVFCPFKYVGSGPPPNSTTAVTYLAVVSIGDYVKNIQLNNLSGPTVDLCIDRQGNAC